MARYIGIFPSLARTTDQKSPNFNNYDDDYGRMHVVVNVSSGSPNLVVKINGYDPASDKDYNLLTSSTLGSGTHILMVGPEQTTSTNTYKGVIPAWWNLEVVQSGAVSATYSVGASLI